MRISSPTPGWLYPLVLFLLSLVLRLHLISKGPYHVDCLALAINAQKTLDSLSLPYQFGTGYPLTILTGSLVLAVLRLFSVTDPVFGVHLMSVIVSSFTVLFFYLFMNHVLNRRSAFLGSLLLSLNPVFLTLSTYGNSHIICVFYLVLAVYFLTHPRIRAGDLCFAVCLGLAGASRAQDMMFLLAPLGLFWMLYKKNHIPSPARRLFFLMVWTGIAILITGLFHISYMLSSNSPEYASQFKIFWSIGFLTNFQGICSPILARSFFTVCYTLTLPGILLVWIGLFRLLRTNIALACLTLAWFFVPFLFYGNLLTSVPRFFFISIIPLYVILGFSADDLLKSVSWAVKILVLIFCLITALYPDVTSVFKILVFRHNHALLKEWAQYIGQHTEPEALIISGDDAFVINYYARRHIMSRPLDSESLDKNQITAFKKSLEQHLTAGLPVYITSCGLFCYNPHREFSSYMETHYRLTPVGRHQTEDWHFGELFLDTLDQTLYRIGPLHTRR